MAAHSAKPAFDFMGHLCGNGSLRRLGLRVLHDLARHGAILGGQAAGSLAGGAIGPLGPAQQPDQAGDHQAQRDARQQPGERCGRSDHFGKP